MARCRRSRTYTLRPCPFAGCGRSVVPGGTGRARSPVARTAPDLLSVPPEQQEP
ncbi:hypothetical protein STTU_4037 [Streptomyces sp. Tu6071]|nr:hypothetical protein STTU_4037 [Streptomyces sp. Tu6071]